MLKKVWNAEIIITKSIMKIQINTEQTQHAAKEQLKLVLLIISVPW